MPAAVIPIGSRLAEHRGVWSLLEVARPGGKAIPFGILLAGNDPGEPAFRFRDSGSFEDAGLGDLDEEQFDLLNVLSDDLKQKGREMGGLRLLESLEDSLSHFLRIGDRNPVAYAGSAQAFADRLFEEHVDSTVREYETHLPLYGLRAAATKFGEGMESRYDSWVRVPEGLKLKPGMFVARVVGRSMEPLIQDDTLCVFRGPVTGSRQGLRVLVEKFDENDYSSRFTVKRYTSEKVVDESGEWRHERIRLEPLNPAFEAFDLDPDQFNEKFRVVAEFVKVLFS